MKNNKKYYPTFELNPLLKKDSKQKFDGSGLPYAPKQFKQLKEKQFKNSSLLIAIIIILIICALTSIKWYNMHVIGIIICSYFIYRYVSDKDKFKTEKNKIEQFEKIIRNIKEEYVDIFNQGFTIDEINSDEEKLYIINN